MRNTIIGIVGMAVLAGCALPGPIPRSASSQAANAETKLVMDDIVHSSVSARTKFLNDHPNDPYRIAIDGGFIQIGMDADEVAAAGFGCDIKEQSATGSVQACQNVIQGATGPTYYAPPTYYVGFDENDKVVSIQNPADAQ